MTRFLKIVGKNIAVGLITLAAGWAIFAAIFFVQDKFGSGAIGFGVWLVFVVIVVSIFEWNNTA